MNEKEIIQRYFIQSRNDPSLKIGIGDDAAVLAPSYGHQLVITTDTMVAGKHFVHQAPPYAIGYKLMSVNLSDIAAMGAVPRWATLNMTLVSVDENWLAEFSRGLLECANKHNVALIGGDTTSGDTLNVSVQLIAEAPSGTVMLRTNAQINDRIFVTGTIGAAKSASMYLQKHNCCHDTLTESQFTALYQPPSRVEFALALREFSNTAIDISDGLLHELEIICEASGVGATVNLDKLSVDPDIDIDVAITGGDDYELLFTASSEQAVKIIELAQKCHCPLSEIGEIKCAQSIKLYDDNKLIPYPAVSGYDHFNHF